MTCPLTSSCRHRSQHPDERCSVPLMVRADLVYQVTHGVRGAAVDVVQTADGLNKKNTKLQKNEAAAVHLEIRPVGVEMD